MLLGLKSHGCNGAHEASVTRAPLTREPGAARTTRQPTPPSPSSSLAGTLKGPRLLIATTPMPAGEVSVRGPQVAPHAMRTTLICQRATTAAAHRRHALSHPPRLLPPSPDFLMNEADKKVKRDARGSRPSGAMTGSWTSRSGGCQYRPFNRGCSARLPSGSRCRDKRHSNSRTYKGRPINNPIAGRTVKPVHIFASRKGDEVTGETSVHSHLLRPVKYESV